MVEELRNRARDMLLTQAIASEEKIDESGPAEDLLAVEGMDKELAYELASRGIRTREELADQSLDELESVPGLDPERAGQIIMAARAHLFETAGQA
jgi:N utilization substance protein A